MRLIGLAVVLALSLFAAPLAAEAQPTGRVARIGVLTFGGCPRHRSLKLSARELLLRADQIIE